MLRLALKFLSWGVGFQRPPRFSHKGQQGRLNIISVWTQENQDQQTLGGQNITFSLIHCIYQKKSSLEIITSETLFLSYVFIFMTCSL